MLVLYVSLLHSLKNTHNFTSNIEIECSKKIMKEKSQISELYDVIKEQTKQAFSNTYG